VPWHELKPENSIIFKIIMAFAFKKLGLGIAFSPRLEALLTETARLKKLWNAHLVIIHVGEATEEAKKSLEDLLIKTELLDLGVTVRWEKGDPASQLLSVCRQERVDLLIAGALKRENLIKYYLGTVARKILRKAKCSVLLLLNPSVTPTPFNTIVVNAEDSAYVEQALQVSCSLAKHEKANWLHIIREVKLYGLTMSASDHRTEAEYIQLQSDLVNTEVDNVKKKLTKIPHEGVKVNIKILSGKSGFELNQFALRKHADLLVIGAPPRRFSLFDRIFPHDQEYIFADLPCNLLIVHPQPGNGNKRKEVSHA
jgi:nucleotide-binding universal stress UspA family protein